jgi:hypothetical protein
MELVDFNDNEDILILQKMNFLNNFELIYAN